MNTVNHEYGFTCYTNSEEARLKVQGILRGLYPKAVDIQETDMPDPFAELLMPGNHIAITDPMDDNTSFIVSYYSNNKLVVTVTYSREPRENLAKISQSLTVEREEKTLHALQAMFLNVAKAKLPAAERSMRLVAVANAIRLLDTPTMVTYSVIESESNLSFFIATCVDDEDLLKDYLGEEGVTERYYVIFSKHK